MSSTFDRRRFLQVTAAAGGGLLVGGWFPPAAGNGTLEAAGFFEPNVWIKVNADDTVRIMLTMLEMGQGVMTSMPMLVAEELDFDWTRIRTEWAGADPKYGNPNFGGQQLTAGSNSVRGMWKVLREAGATARVMLVKAAAQTWGVAEDTCTTDKGEVIHPASGRRLKYGALVDKAAALPVPAGVTLKDPKSFKVLGTSLARLDVPEKVNGTAVFGIDVKLPGLLTARVVRCPVFGGKVARFNADKANAVPGVKHVVQISTGVAVVADDYWSASRGAQALEVTWDEGPLAKLSSADILSRYKELAQKPGKIARNDGDADAVIARSKSFERSFEAPFLAHATMEPMVCTVRVEGDHADVWSGVQDPLNARATAAQALGLEAEQVRVTNLALGGGFGRRLPFYLDYVDLAARIAKEMSPAPVKVVWSRENDIQHDFYRPAAMARFAGGLDGSGKPVGIRSVYAGGGDGESVFMPYAIDNAAEGREATHPIPTGPWRSVLNSQHGFFKESFVDELAHAAGKDPFEFRRDLLTDQPRFRAALERAARMADWDSPLPAGEGRGIAIAESFGSIVAHVAHVAVSPEGRLRVLNVFSAVDCGDVINTDTATAQIEGGVIFGLSAAMLGEITVKDGRVVERNFRDHQVIRIADAPRISVEFVRSDAHLGGLGEPSVPPVAAAVTNAIFAATGIRVRDLPIKNTKLTRNAETT